MNQQGLNSEAIWNFLSTQGLDFGLKVLAAIVAWIIGRWIISLAVRLFTGALEAGKRIDSTLSNYLRSILTVLLNIVLVLAILDIFGIKTTSFAALLAGAGLAIGTAWGGLLTHFAAGVFMQVLRPFKVGDFVQVGGVTGTVTEIGLFGTTVVTPDNVQTIIGNNKIFSDTIQNYSTLAYRRVDCLAKIANGVDPLDAMARLKSAMAAIPNVAKQPGTGHRDPGFHPRRAAAERAPLHPHRPLLAGLFRHPQGHLRHLWCGRLPGAGDAAGTPQPLNTQLAMPGRAATRGSAATVLAQQRPAVWASVQPRRSAKLWAMRGNSAGSLRP